MADDSAKRTDTSHLQSQARTAAWVSLVANIFLMVGKGAVGLLAGSRALVADAVHSAADLAGSVAVMIGLRVARKPPDEDHPYGHGKAELISSAVVSVFLIVAALRVGSSGVTSLWQPPNRPEWSAAVAAAIAIVVKELLYRYNMRIGRRLRSRSLMASAEDHRSDVLSSAAALVGICVSLAGSHWQIHWMRYGDSLASAVVAVLVLKVGIELAAEAVQTLMDRAVPDAQLAEFRQAVEKMDGVKRVDELRARDHGQYIILDVKISVDAWITVAAGHGIAAMVKEEMMNQFPNVQDVLVHVNPFYEER